MSARVVIDELEFEAQYGKLAAKSWHEETDDCKRILALHGWMDNAGSFDHLMPKLKHSNGLYIVALDMPGHGKSSQLAPGSLYSDLHIVLEVRKCLIELNWVQKNKDQRVKQNDNSASISNTTTSIKNSTSLNSKKFSIIGHSLGAGIGLLYASLYPDDVEDVILLDFFKSRTMSSEQLLINVADTIDQFILSENKTSSSPYTSPSISRSRNSSSNNLVGQSADKGKVIVSQEAAIVATIDAHRKLGNLERNDAVCLLKRSTVALSTPPNSVIYSRDLRLNHMLNFREHIELNKIMFSKLKCNLLFVLGTKGIYVENELFADNMETMKKFYEERANCCHIQWLEADHYVHMNQPDKTAEIINKYLKSPLEYKPTEN